MKKILSVLVLLGAMISFNFSFAEEVKEQRMTLKDAIFYALKNNLDLQIQKCDTEIANENTRIAKSKFIPAFSANFSGSDLTSPSSDVLAGSAVSKSKYTSLEASISEQLPFGGTLTLSVSASRSKGNSSFFSYNPSLSGQARLSFTQPLLKNFGNISAKYQIYIAANNNKISKFQLKENINELIFNTESAYWNLVYASQNLEVAKTALERARDLLKQNEIKMKVGTIGSIEVLSSKAGVARNESNVIQAERVLQTSEETLKRVLNLSKETVKIIPADTPEIKSVTVDFNSFLKEAMDNRPDLQRAKLALENQNIGVKYARNQFLPTLNLQAIYYTKGQGGDKYIFRPGFNPFIDKLDPTTDIIGTETKPYGDIFSDVFKRLYNNYQVTLNLSMPVSFAKEKADLAVAKINYKRYLADLQRTESAIYSDVKDIVSAIESNQKLVEADHVALELEGENLKAEEKKLSVGLSTNFAVLTYQQQYANAQVQSLRSTIEYIVSLAKLNKILNRTFGVYEIKFDEILKD